MAVECFRLLQKIRRFQILLIVSLILVISAYLFAVYGWNSRDSFLTACGQYVIPLIMVPLYFIACMEADHVLHLQSVQVRRDRTGRKMDQFLTEMLILAEYMSLYLVLPVMIAGFQSPMVSWFLSSSLCMMMFAGALRLMLMQAVNCSTAAFLAVLIHIVLKVINNWVFLAGTPLLDTPAGVWIRWGISILGYFLFLMNRKWDYDQKRTDAD